MVYLETFIFVLRGYEMLDAVLGVDMDHISPFLKLKALSTKGIISRYRL